VQFSELTLKYNGNRVSTASCIATNPNGNNPDTQTPIIKAIDQDVATNLPFCIQKCTISNRYMQLKVPLQQDHLKVLFMSGERVILEVVCLLQWFD